MVVWARVHQIVCLLYKEKKEQTFSFMWFKKLTDHKWEIMGGKIKDAGKLAEDLQERATQK